MGAAFDFERHDLSLHIVLVTSSSGSPFLTAASFPCPILKLLSGLIHELEIALTISRCRRTTDKPNRIVSPGPVPSKIFRKQKKKRINVTWRFYL